MVGRFRKQIQQIVYSGFLLILLVSGLFALVPQYAEAQSTGGPRDPLPPSQTPIGIPLNGRPCYLLSQIDFNLSTDLTKYAQYLPDPKKLIFRVTKDKVLVRGADGTFSAENLDQFIPFSFKLNSPDVINIGSGKDTIDSNATSGSVACEDNFARYDIGDITEVNLNAYPASYVDNLSADSVPCRYLTDSSTGVPWSNPGNVYVNCDYAQGEPLGSDDGKAASISKETALTRNLHLSPSYVQKLLSQTETSAQNKPAINVKIFPLMQTDFGYLSSNYYLGFLKYTLNIVVQVFPDEDSMVSAADKDLPASIGNYNDINTGSGSSSTPSQPSSTLDFIYTVIKGLVVLSVSVIYQVFAYFLAPVIIALLKIHPYQDSFVNVIYPGWIILRNLANIFFIIALLYFGLSLIFQQGDPKRTRSFIINLVVAALLVNFSLVIAQGILGIADTVQAQFLPADSKVIEALANQLMAKPVQSMNLTAGSTSQELAELTKPIILLFVAAIAFFTFWVLAIALFVRIVAIWILLVTSPIAYVGGLLPVTSKYRSMWFNNFFKYAFVTPIIAFFLNLAALMTLADTLKSGIALEDSTFLGGFTNMGVLIASNALIIGFLLIGLSIASTFKIAVADKAEAWAKKQLAKPQNWAMKQASSLGKAGTDYGKYLGSRGLAKVEKSLGGVSLRPGEYTKAFAEQRKKDLEKALKDRFIPSDGKGAPSYIAKNWGKILTAKAMGFANRANIKKLDLMQRASKAMSNDEVASETAKRDDLLLQTTSPTSEINTRLNRLGSGEVNKTDALDAHALMEQEEKRLKKEAEELEKERKKLYDQGKIDDTENTRRERGVANARQKLDDFKTRRQQFKNQLDALPANGFITVPVIAGFKAVDTDKLSAAIQKEKDKLQRKAQEITNKLNADDALKIELKAEGVTKFDDADINGNKGYVKQARDLQSKVLNARLPESYYARNLRLEREKEAAETFKEIEDIGELLARYDAAVAKKNGALAAALMKKLAREGSFGELLDQENIKSNFPAVQTYIRTVLDKVGFSETDKQQFASELSKINGSNNHAAGMKLVTMVGGDLKWTSEPQHEDIVGKIIGGKSPEDVVKLGKAALVYENDDGTKRLTSGAVKAYTQMSADAAERHMKDLSFNKAKAITDVQGWETQLAGADAAVIAGIKKAARIS